jgi:hypothetical protein
VLEGAQIDFLDESWVNFGHSSCSLLNDLGVASDCLGQNMSDCC